MMQDLRSIAEEIECLARTTGAPLSFVDQVRALFIVKGISLLAEAGPFLEALEEAFRREERIRNSTYRARQNLVKLQENFEKVGRAYVDQVSQIKKMRARTSPRTRGPVKTTQIAIKGDHRTLVTPTEREELPMVPGPEDPQ